MNIVAIENLAKSYGERVLFADVSFGIDDSDKIGLIGVNGTGKSTFLKIIAGLEKPDAGRVIQGSQVRVHYLPQNPEFDPAATVLDQVFAGDLPVMKTLRAYEEALAKVQAQAGGDWEKRFLELSQQMDAGDIWQLESEAKTILTKLGITDFSAVVGTLSGGQRKRIALARALIAPSELLILDEPTNHIDDDMVFWLEQYLEKRKGALLMITHDRYFLDRVVTRTLEIDKGKVYSYAANYSKFLELKAEREAQAESSERKRQNILRNELAWIRRGAQARSTKQKARIERFEALSAQKIDTSNNNLEIQIGASRLGRKIIELDQVSHSFAGQPLLVDFSYVVLKDDRVGIVGANGIGKSTLMNVIAGRLQPERGCVDIGQTVKIGYFSQESSEMDETLRVIDYIREEAHVITTADGTTISAGQMLERFLFPPTLQWLPIAKLSGGERRRLFLLRILMGAPNVLLLDEPTNDLDIQTLAVLEDYLDDFPGAVITVSHDRYFLDRVTDKLFAFMGEGVIMPFIGGYEAYQAERSRLREAAQAEEKQEQAAERTAEAVPPATPKRALKFTYKEQREYEEIDGRIAATEQQLKEVAAGMAAAGSDFTQLQLLTARQQELEGELEELLERWTYLNELAEAIAAGKQADT